MALILMTLMGPSLPNPAAGRKTIAPNNPIGRAGCATMAPMSLRPYKQVDVFTATPYYGNALAVVLEADGMADEEMFRFANWMNLAETTFVLRPTQPGADYRVRIFTTTTELPFAGHPTLGTAHAWLEAGGVPPVRRRGPASARRA